VKTANEFIDSQEIAQIHKSASKAARTYTASFNISIVNDTHQIDLMSMPTDKNKRKYILCVIDVASRYKEARGLFNKTADHVLKNLLDIYKKSPLEYPRQIMTDQGSEFKGVFHKFCEDNNIRHSVSETQHHKSQAFVESMNKVLAKRLFKYMKLDAINNNEEYSDNWYKHLHDSIEFMNNSVHSATKLKPVDAIKLESVKQKKITPAELKKMNQNAANLDIAMPVRYLLAQDETIDGRRRATDPIWSEKIYFIESIVNNPGQPKLYYIVNQDENKQHGFTSIQLKAVGIS